MGVSHPFARIVVHERALRLPSAQGVLRHLGRAAQRLLEITLIAAERPSVDLSDENLAHLKPASALVRCSMLDLSELVLTHMTYHAR